MGNRSATAVAERPLDEAALEAVANGLLADVAGTADGADAMLFLAAQARLKARTAAGPAVTPELRRVVQLLAEKSPAYLTSMRAALEKQAAGDGDQADDDDDSLEALVNRLPDHPATEAVLESTPRALDIGRAFGVAATRLRDELREAAEFCEAEAEGWGDPEDEHCPGLRLRARAQQLDVLADVADDLAAAVIRFGCLIDGDSSRVCELSAGHYGRLGELVQRHYPPLHQNGTYRPHLSSIIGAALTLLEHAPDAAARIAQAEVYRLEAGWPRAPKDKWPHVQPDGTPWPSTDEADPADDGDETAGDGGGAADAVLADAT